MKYRLKIIFLAFWLIAPGYSFGQNCTGLIGSNDSGSFELGIMGISSMYCPSSGFGGYGANTGNKHYAMSSYSYMSGPPGAGTPAGTYISLVGGFFTQCETTSACGGSTCAIRFAAGYTYWKTVHAPSALSYNLNTHINSSFWLGSSLPSNPSYITLGTPASYWAHLVQRNTGYSKLTNTTADRCNLGGV